MLFFYEFIEFLDNAVKLGDYFTSFPAGVFHSHRGKIVKKGV